MENAILMFVLPTVHNALMFAQYVKMDLSSTTEHAWIHAQTILTKQTAMSACSVLGTAKHARIIIHALPAGKVRL